MWLRANQESTYLQPHTVPSNLYKPSLPSYKFTALKYSQLLNLHMSICDTSESTYPHIHLHNFTRLHTTPNDLIRLHTTSYYFIRPHPISHDFTRLHTTSPDFAQRHKASQDFTRLHTTYIDFMRLPTTSYDPQQLHTTSHGFARLLTISYDLIRTSRDFE